MILNLKHRNHEQKKSWQKWWSILVVCSPFQACIWQIVTFNPAQGCLNCSYGGISGYSDNDRVDSLLFIIQNYCLTGTDVRFSSLGCNQSYVAGVSQLMSSCIISTVKRGSTCDPLEQETKWSSQALHQTNPTAMSSEPHMMISTMTSWRRIRLCILS